ncbi:MAG: hypothetical protein JXX28_19420, partial [Deltaproteobacteria bacterium]|nr:hypothetical protein [Deltaproteobacteria bacterium]
DVLGALAGLVARAGGPVRLLPLRLLVPLRTRWLGAAPRPRPPLVYGSDHFIRENNSQAIDPSVSAIDGTLWWYDTDHDQGGALTNVDLYLRWWAPWGAWIDVASSESTEDNMERIHYEPGGLTAGGKFSWQLRPVGSVPADHICASGTRMYLVTSREESP